MEIVHKMIPKKWLKVQQVGFSTLAIINNNAQDKVGLRAYVHGQTYTVRCRMFFCA
jgi:hypothetical protein